MTLSATPLTTTAPDAVALTFDDGPNGADTAALLDLLAEHGIRAVFAVVGSQILLPGGADLLRRIVRDGHVLANHSTDFDDMGALGLDDARQRMRANAAIIADAVGAEVAVPYFRAPNGNWGLTAEAAVAEGMQPLGVVNTIGDWLTQHEAVLTGRLRDVMRPGEIVLVHDGGGDRRGSIAAVRTVVAEHLAAGGRFALPAAVVAPG
jgi:endo-1,4-beta-xylanase